MSLLAIVVKPGGLLISAINGQPLRQHCTLFARPSNLRGFKPDASQLLVLGLDYSSRSRLAAALWRASELDDSYAKRVSYRLVKWSGIAVEELLSSGRSRRPLRSVCVKAARTGIVGKAGREISSGIHKTTV